MKVLSYEAHNVLGVKDIRFDLEGRHLFLVGGKNEQGKTSALTALLMALCGRSGTDYPEVALKEGQDKGWVKVSLSGDEELHEPEGLRVELLLRRKRSGVVAEEFRVVDSTGEEAPEPRTLLKRLYELRAFDPQACDKLDRQEKRQMLAKLLGLDFSENKRRQKELYDQRTEVNRDGVRLKAALESMPEHEDAPAVEVVTKDLLVELERRRGVNAENSKLRESVKSLLTKHAKNSEDADELRRKIDKLQAQLTALEEARLSYESQIDEQRAAVNALKDEDEQAIRRQIETADEDNQKYRENAAKIEARARLVSLRGKSENLSAEMNRLEDERVEALQTASYPVKGLGLDDDGVLYNGLPIEQASKSVRMRVWSRIGMAMNPRLRLLVCQGGGDMDLETLSELEQLAREEGFTIIVEIVTRTAADESLCAVIIKDGCVVSDAEIPSEDSGVESADQSEVGLSSTQMGQSFGVPGQA